MKNIDETTNLNASVMSELDISASKIGQIVHTIQDIASKTVSLQPNITRMVAELENAGLVERTSGTDRRIVIVKLTPRGKELVIQIQKPLLDLHVSQYKYLSKEELSQLNELLIKIAQPPLSE